MSTLKPPFYRRLGRALTAAWDEVRGHSRTTAFAGAEVNRLLLDWIVAARSADEEIRGDLKMLRARARELARNNSYVKRYMKLLANNVVGPMGILLQAKVKRGDEPDAKSNEAIEAAWTAWANGPVTVDGRLTLRRFEALLLKTVATDGEAFVRKWRAFPGNPYGLALQPIDADLIDVTYNRARQGSINEIRMGIEIDALDRVVRYHVWEKGSAPGTHVMNKRYEVPAEDMIHLYDPGRVNQTRGVTWLHSVMVPVKMLGGYEDSEAVAARVGASKMGWWEKKENELGSSVGTEKKPATTEANPGSFEVAPDGYTLQSWDPNHPSTQFGAFVKQMVRKVASGLSVFYNVLANDAEKVTYSTMRSFALIERDDWKSIQQDFIDMWRRPLYAEWILLALTTGALRLASRDPSRYMAVVHRPRGWSWIDPEKEAKGAVLAIENGLGTCTSFLAEKGLDVEEVFAERQHELTLAKKYGIVIAGPEAPAEEKPADAAAQDGSNGDRARAAHTSNRLVGAARQGGMP